MLLYFLFFQAININKCINITIFMAISNKYSCIYDLYIN